MRQTRNSSSKVTKNIEQTDERKRKAANQREYKKERGTIPSHQIRGIRSKLDEDRRINRLEF